MVTKIINYFAIGQIQASAYGWGYGALPALTVAQAAAIDSKLDDGLPQSGRIIAIGVWSQSQPSWPSGIASGACCGGGGTYPGSAASPSANSCYDNGGNSANATTYSLTQNNGNGVNCALSFKMQAGD